MKQLCLIIFVMLPALCRAQYRGGSNDGVGTDAATVQNPIPDIYKGGSNDGHSSFAATNLNALPPIYAGGANDGVASISFTNLNAIPSIYAGGENDGVSAVLVSSLNALPPIYTGGNNDGVAEASVSDLNPLPSIYHGGTDDGVGIFYSFEENPLPQIYTGGVGDGYSMSVSLNRNPSVPLGITLLDFSGQWFNDDAVIAWHTAKEKGLDHFELERSEDEGKSFAAIAHIPPNSQPRQFEYRYTDVRAYYTHADFLLYRLKCVDARRGYRYSAIVKLFKDKTQPVIVAYPNPTNGRFTLALMNVQNFSDYAYVLTSIDGKLISRGDIREATTSFDLSHQPAATYHLFLFRQGKQVQHFAILLTP